MAVITSVNQSPDGYIWVGTDGAELVRYDGRSFEEIKLPNNDNNHHIPHISCAKGEVLFASRYKGFYRYLYERDSLEILPVSHLSFGEAQALFRKESYYYLVGTRGIFSTNGKQSQTLLKLQSDQDNFEFTQFIETENAVFILSNHGDFRLANGKMEPIHSWLNIEKNAFQNMHFGYYDGEKLAFFNETGTEWLEVVLNDRGGFYSINRMQKENILHDGEKIISCSYNAHAARGGILTNRTYLYVLKNKTLNPIAHNYNSDLLGCTGIFTDLLGDYWVNSSLKGLYKISEEPFTKMELHPIYEIPTISLPYRTQNRTILISTYENETFVGRVSASETFDRYEFTVKGVQETEGTIYLATNTGIRVMNEEARTFEIRYFENQNITFILADGHHLWAGIAGKGLYRINTRTGKTQPFLKADFELPRYYYTGQVGMKGKSVYFGSNDGIIQYERSTRKLLKVPVNEKTFGSYSGVSAKDKYGTCWFTLERGLVGITSGGDLRLIQGNEYFQSTLFYTLNSDSYGNLIIGTNKGLTFLKVDAFGKVIDRRHFNDKSGFLGYETNMRSQFQAENSIFLGTVEGLFLINTDMLEHQATPIAPVILPETVDSKSNEHPLLFRFQVNNPKAGSLRYIYRVLGNNEQWFKLDENVDAVDLTGLRNGNYVLEVKASYDGIHYSDAGSYAFTVKLPLWKSNWFVLLMMGVVVLINVFLLNYYKSFDSGKLMNTKDIVVHLRMAPTMLLFAAITAPAAQILGPLFVDELAMNIGQSLVMGFVLLSLYFLSLAAKSSKKQYLYDVYLKTALFIVMANYLWEVYASALHPFNIIGVILISMLAPYILSKIKTTVIFALVLLSIAVCYVSVLNTTVYPKAYFLIAILMMACLMIFASYLRYDSLEKLIFISSIINKGNVPAIAFNKDGKVTYASENIANFANVTHDEIIGNNISILNNFIPYGESYKEKDITREFRDGETYLVPMENAEGTVRWIEWSYKDYSKNIRVILGQDVSEKMELENTYELLVQNAEDFIYRCDIDGRFIFLNDICYSKLGYTKNDLIGSLSVMIVPEEYRDEVREYYKDHFSNKLTSSYKEFPIMRKSGDIIWIGQYVTTLYSAGSDGHVIGYIALARDITEIREQQRLIEDQRDEITSSINYARRIQYNLLPHEKQFQAAFDEHFIISKPKDIVSGDFYWMQRVRDTTVLVVADCTGHGVPGSFMTLLGFNLLNSIVLENGIVNPSNILNELDKKLKEYLPRGKGKNAVNDGMEVTVCVFDKNTEQLSYACAGSRFLVFEKDQFTMFKGDNKHIGDTEASFETYNTHYATFSSDYTLFLFTDGFQDQFGGPKDKKYSFRRLLELFEANVYLPLPEQRRMIEDNFDRWVGKNHQTDDVTIVAVKRNIEQP